MTQSSLCTYRNITSNKSNGRNGNRVCKITPHYMCASWSGRNCADYFASTTRQASSNYCIGIDGDIAMSVDEDDRAWTSSSGWNDRQAITIECGNNSDSSLTDATWNSLVNLCADICTRYGFRLEYTGDKNGSLTEHRMFASTDCPGAWLHSNMSRLAEEVNAILDGGNYHPTNSGASGSTSEDGGTHEDTGFGGTYRCTVAHLNIRTGPSLSSSTVEGAKYTTGETVNLDDWYKIADGYVWGTYVGASGNRRYVAVGRATGKPEDDDYLVKVGSSGSSSVSVDLSGGSYRIVADVLNIRTGAGKNYRSVDTYVRGEVVNLDGNFTTNDGYVWGTYVGNSGNRRYIAVQTTSGDKYAERI